MPDKVRVSRQACCVVAMQDKWDSVHDADEHREADKCATLF